MAGGGAVAAAPVSTTEGMEKAGLGTTEGPRDDLEIHYFSGCVARDI